MNTTLKDVLSLFGIMVLADQKVFAAEIEAFVDAAMRFGREYPHLEMPDEGALHIWYEENREELKSQLSMKHFEHWFKMLCARLELTFDADPLLLRLGEIACADGELHVSELALMELVGKRWAA